MADPKTPAKGAAAPKAPAAKTAAAPTTAAKSIVDAKYRDKYKTPDWLGQTIANVATATKKVQKTEGEGDGKVTKTVEVPAGVNVNALFALCKMNNIDVAKFEAQRDGHGFGGRFRMTVRNLLQAQIKRRHGLFLPGEGGKATWTPAPKDFLNAKGAPEKPTHNQDGSKITPPKAEKPAADAKDADGGTKVKE